jgi:hypothetical protein
MIAYMIGALIAGTAIGIAIGIRIGGSRERRTIQAVALAGAAPGPAESAAQGLAPTAPEAAVDAAQGNAGPELPAPGTTSDDAARPAEPGQTANLDSHLAVTNTNLQAAEAVLDVADRLASQELARRLGDALRLLEGVRILAPVAGSEFEPDLHDWVATRAVTEGHMARTIAATTVPGMTRDDGTVMRKARVIVFE